MKPVTDVDPDGTIAAVIPAYRAERHIEGVLRAIPAEVSLIVVVDDASPDATAAVVERLAASDKRIRLVRHLTNQGVGGATLTGYRTACALGAEVIVKLDSDGQMDPRQVPRLVQPILVGAADYTKGNRFLHARQLTAMPLLRRLGNTGLSLLTKIASGYWKVFDPTNGYTAIHAAIVPLLDETNLARRYFFETSLLLELGLLRAVVHDVPMPARYGDETSHLRPFSALVEFPLRLLAGLKRRLWVQYFVRDFNLASVAGLAGAAMLGFGTLFGAVHWIKSLWTGTPAPSGTVFLAALPVILGVQLLQHAVSLDIQSQPQSPRHRDACDGETQPATAQLKSRRAA